MSLPENGRVVIVDDRDEEAMPLIQILSIHGVPVTYFKGEYDKLPEHQLDSVRIIFLDLRLNEPSDDKTAISTILSVVDKIISPDNGPYLAILWSKHSVDYRSELEARFADKPNKPSMILDLEKTLYLQHTGEHNREEFLAGVEKSVKDQFTGEELKIILDSVGQTYDQVTSIKTSFVPDALERIESKLKKELEKAGVFHLFFLWENIVHKSAGETVKTVYKFFPDDDKWNDNMQNVLYNMAKAYMGKQLSDDSKDIVRASLVTFNEVFTDILNRESRNGIGEFKFGFANKSRLPKNLMARINSKIVLISDAEDQIIPGNVYVTGRTSQYNAQFFRDGAFSEGTEFDKLIIEVSPYCDYAQKKWQVSRQLPGILCPEQYFSKLDNKEFMYISPIIDVGGNIYKIVCDLRFFQASSFDVLQSLHPVFRLKHGLLVEIQSHIARHIGRPGILSLN